MNGGVGMLRVGLTAQMEVSGGGSAYQDIKH